MFSKIFNLFIFGVHTLTIKIISSKSFINIIFVMYSETHNQPNVLIQNQINYESNLQFMILIS